MLKNKNIFLAIFAAAVATIFALALFAGCTTTYASVPDESDAFEVVFPTANYFQSMSPALVSANEQYLIVYDSAQQRLYVRGNDFSTFYYDVSSVFEAEPDELSEPDLSQSQTQSVVGIYAVGSHAFVVTGEAPNLKIFGVDLSDKAANFAEVAVHQPDNIYTFATDGNRLYAKNAAGNIAVYDEDLGVVRDDIYNFEALTGKSNFAVEGNLIYLFTTDEKNEPQLYIYDIEEDSKREIPSRFVQTAYIGDVIYAQISPSEDVENHNKIVCFDKTTGEELYTSNFMPESFCAFGDVVYAINGNSVTGYRFKQTDGSYALEPTEAISMAGNDRAHLNLPSDIVVVDGTAIVADSENSRLAAIDLSGGSPSITPYMLDSKPVRIASGGGMVYALLEDFSVATFEVNDGALTARSVLNASTDQSSPLPFTDIAVLGSKLYAITQNALYCDIGFEFLKFGDLQQAKRLAVAPEGNAIYVLCADSVAMFGANGTKLPAALEGDFSEVSDFAVDYAGDLHMLSGHSVASFKNRVTSLEKFSEIELTSTNYTATATSCSLDGESLYFVAEECFVGKLTVRASQKDDFEQAPPSPDENSAPRFAKLKQGASSYFIPADGRVDGIVPANANILLLLDMGELSDGLSYAMDSDALYIIPIEDFEEVPPTAIDKHWLFREDGDLFTVPYFEGTKVSAPAGTKVTSISDCAGYDSNKWYIVEYQGERYFADPSKLEEDFAPPVEDDPQQHTPEPKPLYGRAKAGRVGGVVNIYSTSSEDSVLARVVDGKKVQILGRTDDHYFVKYGDIEGYMRNSEVKIGGLTTVQIVAIVLSALVLVAGTGIFISIYSIKKRNDNEANAD